MICTYFYPFVKLQIVNIKALSGVFGRVPCIHGSLYRLATILRGKHGRILEKIIKTGIHFAVHGQNPY